MSSGDRNTDGYTGTHPKSFRIWVLMAGVLALMFVAVWMLTGEVRPNLL